MSCSRPSFLVRNNNTSSYFFRSIIPLDLRPTFNNTREFRLSLKTGILSEARRISGQLKFEADSIFESMRRGNSQKTCVLSIKERLKASRDKLLLVNIQAGSAETEDSTSTVNRKEPPPELSEKMKFSEEDLQRLQKQNEEEWEREEAIEHRKALKLVKAYYHRFSYEEIMEFCEENDIDVTEELFPKRYVRKCRQSAVKFLEDGGHILEEAEDIALEVIEAHLDSLSRKKLAEFFSRLGVKTDRFKEAENKKDILNLIDWHADTLKLAYKIGVDILFEEDDDQEKEKEVAPTEKEAPKNIEENYDILCDKWENKYQPPAVEATPEIDQHQVMGQSISASVKPKIPRLSEVIEDYFTEVKTAKLLGPKSIMEKELVIAKFMEITGDLRVDELSHEVARKYKQTLMRLPANMRKDKRYRDLSIEKILQLKDVKPISVTTVNNNLAVVITFMNWAIRNGYFEKNYFAGLKLPKSKQAQDDRKPFSKEDIRKIFNPSMYQKAAGDIDAPSRYWVPLLGAFTGARLNELCQLHVDDIKEEEGVWCISINNKSEDKNNPKKIKNSASKRLVPLHKKLVELGFLEYVRKQKESNHIRLFPELSHGIDGFSKQTSKWFNASYLRKTLGITDKKKTFHSFRHTVANNLKQQGVRESYISELLGHRSGKSESGNRYAKKYRPKIILEEAVSKISYEGLEVDRYEK